ncbi:MAG: hypothetical protein RL365_1967 [Bacteroidota bacterium]
MSVNGGSNSKLGSIVPFIFMKQDGRGMFISYWKDMESIRAWASHPIHEEAKALGIAQWYQSYTSMIAEVERFHEKK